jgi:hypothetical protein
LIVAAKIGSLIYALLLVACACFAGLEIFGFAFAIGDGGGTIGLGMGIFFIATLAGAIGLVATAGGSWTRSRTVSRISCASAVLVLPAAGLYGWQDVVAMWHNSQIGYHYGPFHWASALLPVPFDLAALLFSGLRLRRSKEKG